MLKLPKDEQRGQKVPYIRLLDRKTAVEVSRIVGDARPDSKPVKQTQLSHHLSVGMRWAGKAN